MLKRSLIAICALALPLSVAAETPNLEPGLWEFVSVTNMESDQMTIPEEETSSQECLTEDDLSDPEFFQEGMEGCEISDLRMSRDDMSYTMYCEDAAEGMSVTMEASARFDGDSMEGNMHGEMETPMGEMTMVVSTEGVRIDDC